MKTWTRLAPAALAALALLPVAAAPPDGSCSRPIEVPMAPVGQSVAFDGTRGLGILPALLQELGPAVGCDFRIRRVPRARLQHMFENGQADLLMPATASPSRDDDGEFVPLFQVRPTLLTLADAAPTVPQTVRELLERPDYKLATVRGFSFGSVYEGMVAALRRERRLVEEADPAGVARALRQGLAQGTVMTANVLLDTMAREADLAGLAAQLRIAPLQELGWSDSGASTPRPIPPAAWRRASGRYRRRVSSATAAAAERRGRSGWPRRGRIR
jgi:polar amino acid transport system substrate-binding protein